MMRRFSIFRSFQSTLASRGQNWLPLVALALVSLEANAAVDGEARVQISRQQTQIAQLQNQVRSLDTWRVDAQTQGELLQARYDGLYDVQKDLNTLFVSLREDYARLTGEHNELHDTHQDLQDRFSLILAQVQTLSDEQKIAGQKLAQVESEGANRGVVELLNRMEGLNTDLNRLRGQIEVLTNDNAGPEPPLEQFRGKFGRYLDIDDDGIPYLLKLVNLQRLDLQDTQITAAGLARIHAALPNCKVIHSIKIK